MADRNKKNGKRDGTGRDEEKEGGFYHQVFKHC